MNRYLEATESASQVRVRGRVVMSVVFAIALLAIVGCGIGREEKRKHLKLYSGGRCIYADNVLIDYAGPGYVRFIRRERMEWHGDYFIEEISGDESIDSMSKNKPVDSKGGDL